MTSAHLYVNDTVPPAWAPFPYFRGSSKANWLLGNTVIVLQSGDSVSLFLRDKLGR